MPIAHLPATRRAIVAQAVEHLFRESHFSICKLDEILRLVGAPENTPAYRLLRALHCVRYGEMRPDVLATLPQLVNEAMRPQVDPCQAAAIALEGIEL